MSPSRALPETAARLGDLYELGWTEAMVRHALRTGRLVRVFPRVVASSLSLAADPRIVMQAALLYGGRGACLSHQSAAGVHGLPCSATPQQGSVEVVHVAVPGRRLVRGQPGLVVHRPRWLEPDEVTRRSGLCVTTVERTLVDLGLALTRFDAAHLVAGGMQHKLTARPRLEAQVARHPSVHGTRALRLALADISPGQDSGVEVKLLQAIRRWGLPRPQTGVELVTPQGSRRPDLFWPPAALVVEVDGESFHLQSRDWERDLARDDAFAAIGIEVVHFPARIIRMDVDSCRPRLTAVLRRRWPPDQAFP